MKDNLDVICLAVIICVVAICVTVCKIYGVS